MSSLRSALAFSFLERWLAVIIALGSSAILARVLTPEAIGMFSVSLAVIGVAQVLRDFGVANFLIQVRELTSEHISTALGLLLLLGGTMFLLVFFSAGWIADFYGDPRVSATLRICALNFLILPFCTLPLTLLRREMAFRKVALINTVAAAGGATVSICLALFGFGVTSLAIGAVSLNLLTAFVGLLWGDRRWLARPSLQAWRQMTSYGAQSTLTGVITSLSMDVNDLAVGKVMGFSPVAMLSKAQGLMSLFHRDAMSAVRNVLHSAFAKASREGEDLECFYRKALTNVTVLAWPFYGFLSLFALETMRLLYGPQWDAAVHLVPVFCLAGGIAATASMIGTLFLALGRIGITTKVELAFQPARAALIATAAFVFESMSACAWALVLAMALQVPLLYYFKADCVPNDWKGLAAGLGLSAMVSLGSLVVPCLIVLLARPEVAMPIAPVWFGLAIASCIFSWLLLLVALRHPLAQDPAFQRALSRLGLTRQHNSPP